MQNILKFDTLEEVIDRANDTNFGLAAGIFTSNINTALQFSKHVEAGTVWYVLLQSRVQQIKYNFYYVILLDIIEPAIEESYSNNIRFSYLPK